MARYSKIDRRIWSDAKFRELSHSNPCGQVLFLYLLTNPFVGPVPGIYSAGEAMLSEALGWELEAFREAFRELLREGLVKADFAARLLWIPNAVRYNMPENPNVVKSWQSVWDELPECALKLEAWQGLRKALEPLEPEWLAAFTASCPEPSEKGTAKGMPKPSRKPSAKGMANQEQEQEPLQEQEQLSSPPTQPQKNANNFDGSEWALKTCKAYPNWKDPEAQTISPALGNLYMETVQRESPARGGDLAAAEWLLARVIQFGRMHQEYGTEAKFIPSLKNFLTDSTYATVEMPGPKPPERKIDTGIGEPIEEFNARMRKLHDEKFAKREAERQRRRRGGE